MCFFSTGIDDSLTCSKNGNFDFNGFPLVWCEEYPCAQIKMIIIDILTNDIKLMVEELFDNNRYTD